MTHRLHTLELAYLLIQNYYLFLISLKFQVNLSKPFFFILQFSNQLAILLGYSIHLTLNISLTFLVSSDLLLYSHRRIVLKLSNCVHFVVMKLNLKLLSYSFALFKLILPRISLLFGYLFLFYPLFLFFPTPIQLFL